MAIIHQARPLILSKGRGYRYRCYWFSYFGVFISVTFGCILLDTVGAAPVDNYGLLEATSVLNNSIEDHANGSFEIPASTPSSTFKPTIVEGTAEEIIEYEADLYLSCSAFGRTLPNVSWEYNGKPLQGLSTLKNYQTDQSLRNQRIISNFQNWRDNVLLPVPAATTDSFSSDEDSDNSSRAFTNNGDDPEPDNITTTSLVYFKFPKMNLAFYGNLTCKAKNEDGEASKSYLVVPNANSSVFMKLVRGSAAALLLIFSVIVIRVCQLYRDRKKLQKYKKLSPKEFQIVNQFQKGGKTDPVKTSSSLKAGKKASILLQELSRTQSFKRTNPLGIGKDRKERESMGAGTTYDIATATATTDFIRPLIKNVVINSWIDNLAYESRKEVLKDSFQIDFDNLLQKTEHGLIFSGKFRNPKVMKWAPLHVKAAKKNIEDSTNLILLQGLLAELKVLANLSEDNYFIVNLHAAYTKKLYKGEVYMLMDPCDNGSLSKFIDLNNLKFRDLFSETSNDDTPPPHKKFRIVYGNQNDENANPEQLRIRSFSTEELVVWSAEVADGMNFLHKHKIVHGNLCSANVFLTSNFIAKVGNIGHPPRDSYHDYFRRFPPECKLNDEYSKKSDVWCYGLTLWEIFSLRKERPPSNDDIIDFYSFGKPAAFSPKYSNFEIDELLISSLNPEEESRPNFAYLSDSLRSTLTKLNYH